MRPLNRKPIDPLAEGSPAAEGERTARPLREKPGVLVVDDEHLVRVMVQLGLERNGFDVWLAPDGREAIRLYRKHRDRIAVVLLDVRMPGLDGPQTLDALRELNPKVPACFMSGNTGAYEPEELRQRGAAYVIAKPFRLDQLANVLWLLVHGMPADLLPPGGGMPGVNPERTGTTEVLMSTILVVDDHADTCRNMADLFGELGYLVDAAGGGETALEKARQQPYDLGLLDLRMPGMDGLTLCRHLKGLHPHMVTMIITAYGGSGLDEDAPGPPLPLPHRALHLIPVPPPTAEPAGLEPPGVGTLLHCPPPRRFKKKTGSSVFRCKQRRPGSPLPVPGSGQWCTG
jgi:two-component system, OmpR family, response regulator